MRSLNVNSCMQVTHPSSPRELGSKAVSASLHKVTGGQNISEILLDLDGSGSPDFALAMPDPPSQTKENTTFVGPAFFLPLFFSFLFIRQEEEATAPASDDSRTAGLSRVGSF